MRAFTAKMSISTSYYLLILAIYPFVFPSVCFPSMDVWLELQTRTPLRTPLSEYPVGINGIF